MVSKQKQKNVLTHLSSVFKTETAYQRWDEARKAWEHTKNNCRTVCRETCAWMQTNNSNDDDMTMIDKEEKLRLMRRITTAVWLFPRTLQTHLLNPAEDAAAYEVDVRASPLVDPDFAADLLTARHKPSLVLYELSCAIDEVPLDTIQRSTLDTAVSRICDAMGDCDRIFHSPVPVVYTRFAARFVELFMLFLPLALYKEFGEYWNHWPLYVRMRIAFFFLV